MSRAIAVFHGQFGRATLYQLNRPFNVHAHREGHLIFHVGGADGRVDVDGKGCPVTGETVVAVSPWEPHNFIPSDADAGALFFVLYVNSEWFATGCGGARLRFGRSQIARTSSLDRQVRRAAGMVCAGERLGELDRELRSLIDESHDASWGALDGRSERPALDGATDFRVRKSIRLMQDQAGADIELDAVARESGLSRPHFYKLFRTQTGLTPNLFLNTILMERALDRLVRSEAPVAEIGFNLGFSSQSGFTKFFSANVGMAPTDYRRAAHVI
ncbi:MAG: AraC family transcriptional regulator [Roseiarcus sp.]|uniref:AraC family transcriptional regulator n=1 Tax=Roseiarcus sp. TaxID=1969460 RepID=UPI003C641379